MENINPRKGLRPKLAITLTNLASLSKIIQDILCIVFSPKQSSSSEPIHTFQISQLGELNLKLIRWSSSLSVDFQWNRWKEEKLEISVAIVQYVLIPDAISSLAGEFNAEIRQSFLS